MSVFTDFYQKLFLLEPQLLCTTSNNPDCKKANKKANYVMLFCPNFILTICLLRKFIEKFRLEGTSGMCQAQCPAQSWDNFHIRADCSGPCLLDFWNLQRWRCYNLPLGTKPLWCWKSSSPMGIPFDAISGHCFLSSLCIPLWRIWH